jgi:diguanylate cyclase (GGDEF)-like protein
MRKIIIVIIFIVLSIITCLFLNNNKVGNVKAIKGIMNLSNYNFTQNGIVKLDGQWELYNNKLLMPEDLKNERPDKYLIIPSELKTQLNGQTTGYMTLHLRIYAPEEVVYGFKIQRLLSASKVWVNGVLQGEAGKVGESYKEEKAIYLPIYAYFTSKDRIVDIVIQTSNYTDIFPVIKSMNFGLKNQIMNQFILDAGVDLIIIGGLLILELLFLSLYKCLERNMPFLYFSILCLFIQLRCLFLNERIIVHFFPNMSYELLSKTAALTYYLWVPIYVLFLNELFTNLPRKIIAISSIFSIVFAIICLTTNNTFYDRLSFLSEAILLIIIINILIFLIKKVKEREKNSYISLMAFLFLLVTAINDILVNNGFTYGKYGFQIGMFIFAFLETYILTINYSDQITKSEKLKMENQIIYQKSIRDSMTSLYNRTYIEAILDTMIENYINEGKIFTTLMLDIDYFKSINDNYGHLCGDKVLVAISDLLKKSLRTTDYIGRYGGEEFFVILPNTEKEKAKEIAERIRNNIENLSWKEGINVTISGGLYENDTYTKYECIKNADKLLYIAKEKGRNRIEIES